MRVMLFGSDAISLQCLKTIHNAKNIISNIQVVCPPDRPHGRKMQLQPAFLKQQALLLDPSLCVHQPPASCGFRLKGWNVPPPPVGEKPYDLGVVVSFGYFIPSRVIESFRLGMINIHPSLLPKYRGASPVQYTLWEGETETGVSIITVHPNKIDGGKILKQSRLPVDAVATFGSLSQQLALLGANDLLETISNYDSAVANAYEPDHSQDLGITAPKIKKEEGRVQWHKDAMSIYRHWQGLAGWTVSVFTSLVNVRSSNQADAIKKRCNILTMVRPGTVVFDRMNMSKHVYAHDTYANNNEAPPSSSSTATRPDDGRMRVGEMCYDLKNKLIWIGCHAQEGSVAGGGEAEGLLATDAIAVSSVQLEFKVNPSTALALAESLRLYQPGRGKDLKKIFETPGGWYCSD